VSDLSDTLKFFGPKLAKKLKSLFPAKMTQNTIKDLLLICCQYLICCLGGNFSDTSSFYRRDKARLCLHPDIGQSQQMLVVIFLTPLLPTVEILAVDF